MNVYYHYYAENINGTKKADGIISLDGEVKTKCDYDSVKDSIKAQHGFDIVILKAFTIMGKDNEWLLMGNRRRASE